MHFNLFYVYERVTALVCMPTEVRKKKLGSLELKLNGV